MRGQREFRESSEDVHDASRIFSNRAGVPNRKRGEAVGVDVFRRLDELGKSRERISRLFVERVIDFQQDRVVALHD